MTPAELSILGHVAYRICNTPVQTFPFPHIYVPEVFPWGYYRSMLDSLPPDADYCPGASDYNGRRFADPDNVDIFSVLREPFWMQIAARPFAPWISKRFPQGFNPSMDLRLVRDQKNYAIGPHTDAPWKVLSFLFYLPEDASLYQYGTSIYLPNDPAFRCPGGPHHPFDQFTRIHTAPFLPNTLLAFFKTDYSFHGVEPITIPCQRDVLLWNLYESQAKHGKPTG